MEAINSIAFEDLDFSENIYKEPESELKRFERLHENLIVYLSHIEAMRYENQGYIRHKDILNLEKFIDVVGKKVKQLKNEPSRHH